MNHATTPADLNDLAGWVSLAQAAKMIPSHKAGRKMHLNSVYRIAKKKGFPILRRGPWRFVRVSDLMTLFEVR